MQHIRGTRANLCHHSAANALLARSVSSHVTDSPLPEVIDRLTSAGIAIVEGPVQKSGAQGPITSVYFNDPDGNLIEISRYDSDQAQP